MFSYSYVTSMLVSTGCVRNLRLSRETKSNVGVGRKSTKKAGYESVDKFSQL